MKIGVRTRIEAGKSNLMAAATSGMTTAIAWMGKLARIKRLRALIQIQKVMEENGP